MDPLDVDDNCDEETILKARPNLKEIKSVGLYYKVKLYYDPDYNQYWEKGGYGRWDMKAYRLLNIKNESQWAPQV